LSAPLPLLPMPSITRPASVSATSRSRSTSSYPETLPLRKREVLVPTPTLLAYHDDRPALGGWEQDFEADVLWREGYPRFGARPAPLSHVGDGPQPLPAGASPHLPTLGGRLRDESLEDGARRPATPNIGPVGWVQYHR